MVEESLAAHSVDFRAQDLTMFDGLQAYARPFDSRQQDIEHSVADRRAVAFPIDEQQPWNAWIDDYTKLRCRSGLDFIGKSRCEMLLEELHIVVDIADATAENAQSVEPFGDGRIIAGGDLPRTRVNPV